MNEETNSLPGCAAFETLLEALKWKIVRREKDRVIIERAGEEVELKKEKGGK